MVNSYFIRFLTAGSIEYFVKTTLLNLDLKDHKKFTSNTSLKIRKKKWYFPIFHPFMVVKKKSAKR